MKFLLLVGLFALAYGVITEAKTDIGSAPILNEKKKKNSVIGIIKVPKKLAQKTEKKQKKQKLVQVSQQKKVEKKVEKKESTKKIIKQILGLKKCQKVQIGKLANKIIKKINQTIVFKPSNKTVVLAWKKCAARITTEQNLKVLKNQQHTKVKKIQAVLRKLTAQFQDFKTKAKYHNKIASGLSRSAHTCQAMILSRLQTLYSACVRHTQKVKGYNALLCGDNKGNLQALWKKYKKHWTRQAKKNLTIAAKQPMPKDLTQAQMGCYTKCYNKKHTSVKQMKCFGDCVEKPSTKKIGNTAYNKMLQWVSKIRTCEKSHYAALAEVVKCVPWALRNKPDCPKTRRAIRVVRNWASVQVWPF